MSRAMSSASIRSVRASVPRESANALICARDKWKAMTCASTSSVQSTHSWPPVASNPTFTGPDSCWIILTNALWPSGLFRCRNRFWLGRQNTSSQSRDTSIPRMVILDIMLLSLPYASRAHKMGGRQLFETVRRGGISLLENVVRPQDVQRCIQPRRRSWPGAATGYL